MKTLTRDGRLADALAALYGYLRMGPRPFLENEPHASADAFIDALADHLRHEEERVFPTLREAKLDADPVLDPLRKEHARLRDLASRLAQRMSAEDYDGAADVALACLETLLKHLRREERAIDVLIGRLPPETTDRLLRRIGLHWTEEG
ncbi:MAG TPA: hemerythrin domain-containing protein [Planctomycetota bacterium]